MEIVVGLILLALVIFIILKKKGSPPASHLNDTELQEEAAPLTAPSRQTPDASGAQSLAKAPPGVEPEAGAVKTVDASVPRSESQATREAETGDSASETVNQPSSEKGISEIPPTQTAEFAPSLNTDGRESDISPPPPPTREAAVPAAPRRRSGATELQSLRKGLAKSREKSGVFGRLRKLLGGQKEIQPDIAEDIEEVLLSSDVGVSTTERILDRIKGRLNSGELKNETDVWDALREEARRTLSVDGRSGGIVLPHRPSVVLLVGVNGAGKTTTAGKLAKQFSNEGKKVMLAAGDTFRAAAVDQLKAWGERVGCEVISGKDGADPSSVLFDAVQAAKDGGVDVLLADTAGRLHTNTNLMQEMTKISKTLSKALEGAPHEILLVIDATNGQNAMAQAREFKEALQLSGLILTKLDGTARGGAILGICDGLQIPVRYIGVGERTEDLHEFDTNAFIEALLGGENDPISV